MTLQPSNLCNMDCIDILENEKADREYGQRLLKGKEKLLFRRIGRTPATIPAAERSVIALSA